MENFKEIILNSNYKINLEFLEEYFIFLSNKVNPFLEKPFEKHHILPSALFPEYDKIKINLIKLTPKDHFIAHYLLAKAIKEKQSIFAFNQMKRVLKKYGKDYKDLEYLSNLYQEFREELSKLLSELVKFYNSNLSEEEKKIKSEATSKRFKGKVPVRFLDGSTGLISKTHPDYLSGIVVSVQTGTTRSEKAKENFRISNSPKTRGYPYYNPVTLKVKYFHREDAPIDWISGSPVSENSGKPGAKFYYDPNTKQQHRFYENEIPEGWIKGKINSGQDNPFKKAMFIDPINHKGVPISKEIPVPKFYHNHASKNYYFWTDEFGKWFTSKKSNPSKVLDYIIEIKTADFSDDIFNEYQWVYLK